jgi:hypothetical protein
VIKSADVRRAVNPDMVSDPDDPHGWMFDCEVLSQALKMTPTLRAWWVCRRCSTTVRVSAVVTRRPHSGNEAYDEMAALSELSVKAAVARKGVHPRCSEVRLVRDVMES